KRENQVGVHVTLVNVEHEVGKDVNVVGVGAGADVLDGAALGGGGRLEGADLGAGEGGELGAVSGVIEDAGEAGRDRVEVIAAVEVVVDEDLPVAGEVVRAAADEVEAL